MKLNSARGSITIDEGKYKYMIVYDSWNYYKNEWKLAVYKRTNDEKVANRELKKFIENKCNREVMGHISAMNARLVVNQ